MKKVITVLVVFIILGLAILLTGCNEESVQNSRETLLSPEKATIPFAKQWVAKYGTSEESVDNYNSVLVRMIVDQNANVMNKLAETVKGGMEETGKQLSALSAKQDTLDARIMLIENSIRLDRGSEPACRITWCPIHETNHKTYTGQDTGDKNEN